ncbi:MAG: sigma-70 family RNA polymerase sigma factor [Chloroflexota bacterium]|jgi:RNA polymerase sigma-70 factor (ECF subfamily)
MTGTNDAPGEPGDSTLVEAARRGDLYAWERLVRRYQEPVFRVAWLVTRDTEMAEKVTQSTFVRAFRALPSMDDEIGLLPWLIRIAAGESRQQRRESGRPSPSDRPKEKQVSPQLPASAIPGLSEADELTSAERQAISEAFDRLGEEDRLVIAARYLFGLTRTDAANALSIGSKLVDEQLSGAVSRLRARVVLA